MIKIHHFVALQTWRRNGIWLKILRGIMFGCPHRNSLTLFKKQKAERAPLIQCSENPCCSGSSVVRRTRQRTCGSVAPVAAPHVMWCCDNADSQAPSERYCFSPSSAAVKRTERKTATAPVPSFWLAEVESRGPQWRRTTAPKIVAGRMAKGRDEFVALNWDYYLPLLFT